MWIMPPKSFSMFENKFVIVAVIMQKKNHRVTYVNIKLAIYKHRDYLLSSRHHNK